MKTNNILIGVAIVAVGVAVGTAIYYDGKINSMDNRIAALEYELYKAPIKQTEYKYTALTPIGFVNDNAYSKGKAA